MPCEYQVFEDENLIVKVYSGRVTSRCILDVLDRLEADPKYHEGMCELYDLRAATEFALTEAEIAKLAELMAGINKRRQAPIRVATVADSAHTLKMASAYRQNLEAVSDMKIQICGTLQEALVHLGRDADMFAKSKGQTGGTLH